MSALPIHPTQSRAVIGEGLPRQPGTSAHQPGDQRLRPRSRPLPDLPPGLSGKTRRPREGDHDPAFQMPDATSAAPRSRAADKPPAGSKCLTPVAEKQWRRKVLMQVISFVQEWRRMMEEVRSEKDGSKRIKRVRAFHEKHASIFAIRGPVPNKPATDAASIWKRGFF